MGRPDWFPDVLSERPEGEWYRPRGRVYMDLNAGTDPCPFKAGTFWDLRDEGIEPKEGISLLFYMDDGNEKGEGDYLLFSGVIHRDPHTGDWFATVDESSFQHESDLLNQTDPPDR